MGKQRIAEECRKIRKQMEREEALKNETDLLNLLDLVYTKRESFKVSITRVNTKSRDFLRYSYGIASCEALIHDILETEDLPFLLKPEEILDMYAEKMSRFSKETPKREYAYCFKVGEAVAVNLKKKWRERREMECIRSNALKHGGTGEATAT